MDDFQIIVLALVIVFLAGFYLGKIKSYFFAGSKRSTVGAAHGQDAAANMYEETFRDEFFKALGGEITRVDENMYFVDYQGGSFGFKFFDGNTFVKIFFLCFSCGIVKP